jgi:hypothetical protein
MGFVTKDPPARAWQAIGLPGQLAPGLEPKGPRLGDQGLRR